MATIGAMAALLGGCAPAMPISEPHELLNTQPHVSKHAGLNGKMIEIPAPGTVTVVDFWATYCKPCLALMPHYEALHQDLSGAGVVVLGVAADDNPGLVFEHLRSLGVTYGNLLDDGARLQGVYQVEQLPNTLVFDRHGRLRLVVTGGTESDADRVRAGVEALLRE